MPMIFILKPINFYKMKKLLLTLLVLLSARMGAQITSENLGSKDMDGTRKVTVVLPDGYDKREKISTLCGAQC